MKGFYWDDPDKRGLWRPKRTSSTSRTEAKREGGSCKKADGCQQIGLCQSYPHQFCFSLIKLVCFYFILLNLVASISSSIISLFLAIFFWQFFTRFMLTSIFILLQFACTNDHRATSSLRRISRFWSSSSKWTSPLAKSPRKSPWPLSGKFFQGKAKRKLCGFKNHITFTRTLSFGSIQISDHLNFWQVWCWLCHEEHLRNIWQCKHRQLGLW